MIAAGLWQPFTDVAPVRAHVQELLGLGIGQRQIAELAGCDRKWVRDVAHGVRHDPGRGNPVLTKVRSERAAAVLAIPVDPLEAADGASIPAGPVWEWIDRLLRAGWTKAALSAQIGQGGRALQLSRSRVSGRNARAIYAVYVATFGDARPRDDVDWVRVERAVSGIQVALTFAERREVVALLYRMGCSDQEIARRSGMADRTVLRIREELELPARVAAAA